MPRAELFALNIKKNLNAPVEKYLKFFSPQRQMEILRYKFHADRNRTLWAELLIRRVVAKKLSRPFEKILIRRDERGKPFVADCLLAISLSHGGDWAVAAVADSAIGIDVEIDSEDALLIAENFFFAQRISPLTKSSVA